MLGMKVGPLKVFNSQGWVRDNGLKPEHADSQFGGPQHLLKTIVRNLKMLLVWSWRDAHPTLEYDVYVAMLWELLEFTNVPWHTLGEKYTDAEPWSVIPFVGDVKGWHSVMRASDGIGGSRLPKYLRDEAFYPRWARDRVGAWRNAKDDTENEAVASRSSELAHRLVDDGDE